jgi:hypothetical protein
MTVANPLLRRSRAARGRCSNPYRRRRCRSTRSPRHHWPARRRAAAISSFALRPAAGLGYGAAAGATWAVGDRGRRRSGARSGPVDTVLVRDTQGVVFGFVDTERGCRMRQVPPSSAAPEAALSDQFGGTRSRSVSVAASVACGAPSIRSHRSSHPGFRGHRLPPPRGAVGLAALSAGERTVPGAGTCGSAGRLEPAPPSWPRSWRSPMSDRVPSVSSVYGGLDAAE